MIPQTGGKSNVVSEAIKGVEKEIDETLSLFPLFSPFAATDHYSIVNRIARIEKAIDLMAACVGLMEKEPDERGRLG